MIIILYHIYEQQVSKTNYVQLLETELYFTTHDVGDGDVGRRGHEGACLALNDSLQRSQLIFKFYIFVQI